MVLAFCEFLRGMTRNLLHFTASLERESPMKLRTSTLLLFAAALTLVAAPAFAQDACQSVSGNLVTNCGFETGDFTGWTPGGNFEFSSVTNNPTYVSAETSAPNLDLWAATEP